MNTFLRFTENFDKEKSSYLKTATMKKAKKLQGICAFNFDLYNFDERREMTYKEIVEKVKGYSKNFPYYDSKIAVIFEGEFIEQGNEGVIVRPLRKIHEIRI